MSETAMPPPAPPAWPPPPARARPPVGHIVLTVVGAVLVLVALGLGAVGGIVTWAYATQRDADGFFTTSTQRFATPTYAITSEHLDLGVPSRSGGRPFDIGDLATVRLSVTRRDGGPVFIGIGPEKDVDRYLRGVAHDEITHIGFGPFRVTYDFRPGGAPAGPPGAERFWAASALGRGEQNLEWDLHAGRWSVVVMNRAGTRAVDTDIAVGAKADWVLPLGLGLLGGSVVLLAVGTTLLVVGALGLARHGQAPVPAGTVAAGPVGPEGVGPEPVRLVGHVDAHLSRWLWLVKWILLVPHFVALFVLWAAFVVASIVAGFAILFTGRYPRSLFDFNAGVLRWTWRVSFYSFAAFGTDRYPPFTLGDVPDYPARLEIAYPERLSRGLVLVKWWLLAIPHYVVLAVLLGGSAFAARGSGWAANGPGLVTWLALVAVVALLFVGRYPRGIADLVVGLNRWVYRVIVYVALMTDEYPPFRLDQGADPDVPTTTDARSSPGSSR
ncbi:MAG: DUF4389 domain-containing protein [Acidimicrobiia bacterium]